MARDQHEGHDEGEHVHGASQRAAEGRESGATGRDRYRDNDDTRDPIAADDRSGTAPDTRFEARGDARENVGNHARGTAADPTGPEGNDRTRGRQDRTPESESFDDDLARDNRKARD
jgi:hypothetical protein